MDQNKCLSGDNRPVHSRGVCKQCYEWARKRVARGELTWEKLEELGRVNRGRRNAMQEILEDG